MELESDRYTLTTREDSDSMWLIGGDTFNYLIDRMTLYAETRADEVVQIKSLAGCDVVFRIANLVELSHTSEETREANRALNRALSIEKQSHQSWEDGD